MFFYVHFIIIAGFIDLSSVLGQKVSLQSDSASVALGKSFQFICRITESGSLGGLLYTNRGTPSLTVCTVNSGDCSQFSNTNGYSCGCVEGQTGVYFTNISSVKLDDRADNWVCQYSGVSSNRVPLEVIYPPTITTVPNSINVTEYYSPNIDCSSNITPGNPLSTSYRWTGPGGYSKTGSILDRTVTRTQGGQYTCTATNTAGLSDTAKVNITVLFAPAVTIIPSSVNMIEYNSPNIDCSSNITPGNPSSTSYRWTGPGGYSRDQAVLDRTVTRTQGGQYICTATNTAGLSDTATVDINVLYAPAIKLDMIKKTVIENTSPNIDCSSNITPGNPSSTSYRWTGPGGYSKTGAVLDRTVTRTQGGQYTCTATNTAGLSDMADININIQYAPELNIVPNSVNTTEHTSPNIDCSNNITPGNPSSTSYRWTGPGGYSKTGSVLDRTVTRTQGGQYTCTATNTAGLSETATVNISVQYPPAITSVPNNKDVTEHTTVNIDCSSNITPGNPSSTSYRWTGPGGYSKTGAVFDRTVTRTQGGQYFCTATNTAGLSDKATVNIDILYLGPPKMYISPIRVNENASVELFCNVTSKPTVQMTIKNLDNNINLVDQLTNSRHYIIERAQCLHNGTFQCLACNKETDQTKTVSVSLNVLCSPRKDGRKVLNSDLTRPINEIASLVVNVIANPSPTFTWRRYVDGQREPITERIIHRVQSTELQSTLQITVTNVRDNGQYAVHVENEVGDILLIYSLSATPTIKQKTTSDDRLGIGVAIGVSILVPFILLFIVLFIRERHKRKQMEKDERYHHLQRPNDDHYATINSRHIELTEHQDLDGNTARSSRVGGDGAPSTPIRAPDTTEIYLRPVHHGDGNTARSSRDEGDGANSTPVHAADTTDSYLSPVHHEDSKTVKNRCNDAVPNSTEVRRDSCTSQTFQKQT